MSSSRAFPTRMAKKCQIDLIKSHLPKSPAKKVAVVAAPMENPTSRSRLECEGLVPSAENREADVALSVMQDARRKSQRPNDSLACKQTFLLLSEYPSVFKLLGYEALQVLRVLLNCCCSYGYYTPQSFSYYIATYNIIPITLVLL